MINEPIQISENRRFLEVIGGEPFFWLGDTAWELFHRLTLAEAEHYLEVRRQQSFNVIQAVVLAEMDGLHTPNANGHVPLLGDDPLRPNEFYFRHVDAVVNLAAQKGLYIGLLPTWGDKVNGEMWGTGPVIFTPDNAFGYGKILGERYREANNILWILGGDRPAEGYESFWAKMASGISEGLGRKPFFTYHPSGGLSSSRWLHDAGWLDMNMLQSGHGIQDAPNWKTITDDYNRTPIKPVLDGEPNYEDHPVDPWHRKWLAEHGRYTDHDVRKAAYRAVFSGSCGHTYGHHSVWQFWTLDRAPVNYPMPTWDEAILRPGARQLVHLKNLVCSRPYFERIPDQEMLVGLPELASEDMEGHANPVRAAHMRATRADDGSYAMVYFPLAKQEIEVDLRRLSGEVKAWWYDPRDGASYEASYEASYDAGEYPREIVRFRSPVAGPDWVLVLDDASRGFGRPGV